MAWCRQAASHYLSQCWPRSVSPYDVNRPQWVITVMWVIMMTTKCYMTEVERYMWSVFSEKKILYFLYVAICITCHSGVGRLASSLYMTVKVPRMVICPWHGGMIDPPIRRRCPSLPLCLMGPCQGRPLRCWVACNKQGSFAIKWSRCWINWSTCFVLHKALYQGPMHCQDQNDAANQDIYHT